MRRIGPYTSNTLQISSWGMPYDRRVTFTHLYWETGTNSNNQPSVLCSFHLATAAKGDLESPWGHQDHCLKDSCVVFNLSPELVNDLEPIDSVNLDVLREDNIHRFINVGIMMAVALNFVLLLLIYLLLTYNASQKTMEKQDNSLTKAHVIM